MVTLGDATPEKVVSSKRAEDRFASLGVRVSVNVFWMIEELCERETITKATWLRRAIIAELNRTGVRAESAEDTV